MPILNNMSIHKIYITNSFIPILNNMSKKAQAYILQLQTCNSTTSTAQIETTFLGIGTSPDTRDTRNPLATTSHDVFDSAHLHD
jgi:hypothetical protein